ncbi:MAG TPA: bifunctional 4-hydroxy-2-oxoglutarate aldolase/2-dehydro-3-deoxy-phosphogluconate aldolase [Nocardioidaceae bacterium]|nr:bifunctional 4-hydroxy-2-oxoglutarate aldolase/2-dehydro-3-deoxy-phosphogluconate aldolase [Nocardioidaceae bacterium]
MSILDISPVVPVVVLDDPHVAVPLAQALVAGGIRVIELTLRTPTALESIERIAGEVEGMTVGAGTVIDPDQAKLAADAGAAFLVSPGVTSRLLDAMADTGLPFLPGCATVTEVLELRERGLTELKFFPAEASGGAAFLRSLHGPVPDVRFCPTGGIGPDNAASYLPLPNVGCVGGSWLTPADAVARGDWRRVSEWAAEAAGLRF